MNISSILIIIVGILIIFALYVVSRIGQSKPPYQDISSLPNIKDDDGSLFTSVLDDIPASDGSTPLTNKEKSTLTSTKINTENQQIILFISADNGQLLDGDLIKQALLSNNLSLGENDIYHYLIEKVTENAVIDPIKNANNNQPQQISLFRIANGVKPWTLKDKDLEKQQLIGLSIIMYLSNAVEKKQALTTFIEKSDAIATQINGILKTEQGKILSAECKEAILSL